MQTTNNRGQVDFVCNGSFSGIADKTYLWSGDQSSIVVSVDGTPLADIFETLPANQNVDVLDIDVEGHDYEVLVSFDMTIHHSRLILIESHNLDPSRDIHGYLTSNEYSKIVRLRLTDVYEDVKSHSTEKSSL